MRRWAWSLLVAAGIVLIAGIVHVGLAFSEHVRHPEWSAPAYVTIIYIVPYVLAAATLASLYLWHPMVRLDVTGANPGSRS